MYDLVVAGAQVVTPHRATFANLGILDGKFAAISLEPLKGDEVIDARGKIVFPGVVDLHVHFNEPGRTDWEGWAHGSRAAAAGGVTTVVEMPLNAIPPTTTRAALETKVEAARSHSVVDFALWGGLVTDNLADVPSLAQAGVSGFKAFMTETGTPEFTRVDDVLLRDGMRRLKELDHVLAVHAEDDALIRECTGRLRADGRRDLRAWGESRPPAAEMRAVERALRFAAETGCRLHIVHLSLPEALPAITAARGSGVAVTVETCPHYLTLTDEDLLRLGPVAKCAPPLRDGGRREALWKAIRAGQIDCVTSDHSPCPAEAKLRGEEDIFEAWGGITGVQTLLSLMLTEGVHRRNLPLTDLAELLAANPARLAGLWPRKGGIMTGADADLVIIDMEGEWKVDRSWLESRHPHSPFIGWAMKGRIDQVLLRGRTIAGDGALAPDGGGVWLSPDRKPWISPQSSAQTERKGENICGSGGSAGWAPERSGLMRWSRLPHRSWGCRHRFCGPDLPFSLYPTAISSRSSATTTHKTPS